MLSVNPIRTMGNRDFNMATDFESKTVITVLMSIKITITRSLVKGVLFFFEFSLSNRTILDTEWQLILAKNQKQHIKTAIITVQQGSACKGDVASQWEIAIFGHLGL